MVPASATTLISPRQEPPISFGTAVTLATERLVDPVEGMHRAISGRWFDALGPVARPIRRIHDTICDTTYGVVRLGATALGVGLDLGVHVSTDSRDATQAVVNGLWGDALGRHEARLATAMGIRGRNSQPVAADDALAASFPSATGRLVVLVHGWAETEHCWRGTENGTGLLAALEMDPLHTPLTVRYNSGLRISHNGSLLAGLLEDVCAHWPVEVESISLVGHSMGGLVIRSACTMGAAAGHDWVDRVSDVVTLGTPHGGAPLEKLVNVAAWGLRFAPESRPLADYLDTRSGGLKDLRFGAIAEEDWRDHDADALLRNTVGDHDLPAGIDHHFVSGVVTADPRHPVGALVGDLIVRTSSGSGGSKLTPTDSVVVGSVNHSRLVDDPIVIDHILRWVVRPSSA